MPYYPFVEALAAAVLAAPASIREELPRSWPEVARLLPGTVHDPETGGAYRRAEEQQRLYWSVVRFIQALAQGQPVALLLDDLQWADEASLGLLQHLGEHTRAAPVFVLATYRDSDTARRHPLRQMIHHLGREHLAERIPVPRLSKDGTGALVATIAGAGTVPSSLVDQIHRGTDGNPFFTVEVLLALRQRGADSDGRWAGGWRGEWRDEDEIVVPETVQSAIDERLARLDPLTQELLQSASVLGESFRFDDLLAMQPHGEDEIESALEGALTAALIQDIGPDRYAFNHMLTQQALYRSLPHRRRKRLHLAAGAALESLMEGQQIGRASELAWHFSQAEEGARALPYILEAGNQAQDIYAYAAAESRYRSAVELARKLGDAQHHAEALTRLGRALLGLARWDEANAALREAAEMHIAARADEALAQDIALLCRVYTDRGIPEAGIGHVLPLMARLSTDTPAASLAPVYVALSHLYLTSGHYPELHTAAARAVALALESGNPRLVAEAKGRYGVALGVLGRFEDAIASLAEVVRLAEASGALESQVLALNNMAHCHLILGPLVRAREECDRALELAPRLHSPVLTQLLLVNRAYANYLLGEWPQVHVDLDHAERDAQETGVNAISASLLTMLGRLYLAEGRPADAARVIAEGMAVDELDSQTLLEAHATLAEREILAGEPRAARERLDALLEGADREEPEVRALVVYLGWAHLALDQIEEAEAAMSETILAMRAIGMRVTLADALRVQALIALRRGELDAAEAALDETVALAKDVGYPLAQARALHVWGLVEQERGDLAAAVTRLRAARALFARLGARGELARTERALSSLEPQPLV